MKKPNLLMFVSLMMFSLSLFANECPNLTGTYKLEKGSCKNSKADQMDQIGLIGRDTGVAIYQNSVIKISQKNCDGIILTRVEGQMGPDQKYYDVDYAYNDDGIGNTLSYDEQSMNFTSTYIAGILNKLEKMKLTATKKGLTIDYSLKGTTFAFVPLNEKNSCELTRINEQ